MILTYSLEEKDYLNHQLYFASKSERINKKRQRSRMVIPIAYLVLSLLFFANDNIIGGILFILIGLVWYVAYPKYLGKKYIKHFTAHINENLKEQFGIPVTMELSDEQIIAKDKSSESKVATTEVKAIAEIPSNIFISLKGGQHYILPNDNRIDLVNVKAALKALTAHLQIAYTVDDKWEWK